MQNVSVPFRGFDVSNDGRIFREKDGKTTFPSPSGALMFLTGYKKSRYRRILYVSVPFRGFDVSNGYAPGGKITVELFPSPSGALMFLTDYVLNREY